MWALCFTIFFCHLLSKFIYSCQYGFLQNVFYGFLDCVPFYVLSNVLVLQVLTARFGLIRPTAVTGPFCLKHQMRKTPEERLIHQGIQMQQQNPSWERTTCLFLPRKRYITLSLPSRQHRQRKWSKFDPTANWKGEEGGQVTTDPPEQATLAPRQLSHHFPLSPKLTHVRPWPETAPPWATYWGAQGGARLPLSRLEPLFSGFLANVKSLFFSHWEVLFPRGSWPG